MGTVYVNSKRLFKYAHAIGSLSKEAYEILLQCNHDLIDEALSGDMDFDTVHFNIMVFAVDDSLDIAKIVDVKTGYNVGAVAICSNQTTSLRAILGSRGSYLPGIFVITWLMNSKKPVQKITNIADPNIIMLRNEYEYHPTGKSTLLDHSIQCIATALAFKFYVRERFGAKCKGSIWIVSNGHEQDSTLFSTSDVKRLVQEAEDNFEWAGMSVIFMGISEKYCKSNFREVAESFGISKNRVFDDQTTVLDIRHAFYARVYNTLDMDL